MNSDLIERHNKEIHENALLWKRKNVLRRAYALFYREIKQQLSRYDGPTVELGSGIGQIKEYIPEAVTTDLFANPWLDRVENSYRLSFPDESVANLILFDVWHHLEFPGSALDEAFRVLRPGGRLQIFDPAMGLLARLIFERFHHEPLGLEATIQWKAPASRAALDSRYYAAQGNAWRVFHLGEYAENLRGWQVIAKRFWPATFYLASGGFRGPQLYPEAFFPFLCLLDRTLEYLPDLFASRMLIVLEKPLVRSEDRHD